MHTELAPLVDMFEDAGGIFAVLMFVHFIADFIQQSSYDTDVKYTSHRSLFKHSLIYTIQFLPFMFFLKMALWEICLGVVWLLLTHFAIDSMWFTKLWVFKLYKPPELFGVDGIVPDYNCKVANAIFFKWAATPNGRLRVLLIDQIQHATALWPIVIMVLI